MSATNLPVPPVTVQEPATVETLAAAINILLAATSQIIATLEKLADVANATVAVTTQSALSSESLAQIPNPITVAQAKALAQAKEWKMRINSDDNGIPVSVSFGASLAGIGDSWFKTVNLSI